MAQDSLEYAGNLLQHAELKHAPPESNLFGIVALFLPELGNGNKKQIENPMPRLEFHQHSHKLEQVINTARFGERERESSAITKKANISIAKQR